MKEARVIYNEKEDAFEIQINTGDGWGLETSYRFRKDADYPEADADFISWRIIDKLGKLQYLGYKIKFLDWIKEVQP